MRNKLLSSLAGAAFSFAASGLAFAQAPAPPPAPVYNWTGWYAGVNVGASFGNVKTDFNAPATVQASVEKFETDDHLTLVATGSDSFTTLFAGSNREYPSGFIGGGQIGYNYQLSPIWVVGLEADFQGAAEKDSIALTNNFSDVLSVALFNVKSPFQQVGTTPVSVTGSTVLDYQTKIDWFGTARVRAGYLWGDGAVMSYVTGGLAYGRVGLDATDTTSATVGL